MRKVLPVLVGLLTSIFAANAQVGQAIAWGDNADGKTNLPPGLTNCVAIAAGQFHALALGSNGSLAAWGRNLEGQTNVPTDLTNVIAISAGSDFSLALKVDGTVRAWGKYWDPNAGPASYVPI